MSFLQRIPWNDTTTSSSADILSLSCASHHIAPCLATSSINLQNMFEMKYRWKLRVTWCEKSWVKHLKIWGLGVIHLLKWSARQCSRLMMLFQVTKHTISAPTITSNSTPSHFQYTWLKGIRHSNQQLNGCKLTHSKERTDVKYAINQWLSISRLLPPRRLWFWSFLAQK